MMKEPIRGRRQRLRKACFHDKAWDSRRKLLNEFGSRVEWFKNEKFLTDLEGDSLDTEILDEELRSLQEEDRSSCRGKTVIFLESNPLQIVLCVLVLVDAGIVVAEILLDLHAIRGQYIQADSTLKNCLSFLKTRYANDITDYSDHDSDVILDILRHQYPGNRTVSDPQPPETDNNHRKRHVTKLRQREATVSQSTIQRGSRDRHVTDKRLPRREHSVYENRNHRESRDRNVNERKSGLYFRLLLSPTPLTSPIYDVNHASNSRVKTPSVKFSNDHQQLIRVSSMHGQSYDVTTGSRRRQTLHNDIRPEVTQSVPQVRDKRDTRSDDFNTGSDLVVGGSEGISDDDDVTYYAGYDGKGSVDHVGNKKKTKTKLLLKIAHVLHYISIAILGIFVIQVILKIIAMGADFFRRKMEMFDAVIIVASFMLDIVFLEGIGPGGLDKGAALVIIFLLWRLLRVINGIMVTAKQRQEFRIKLQKRARRRAEKKIEALEEEKHFKEKEITNLQMLCKQKGATEQEINFCKPRKRNFAQKNTTAGLSSIASLSLGFTMSMHLAGGSNNTSTASLDQRRLSALGTDAFPGLSMLIGPGSNRTGRRISVPNRSSSATHVGLCPASQRKAILEHCVGDKSSERAVMEPVIEEPGDEVDAVTARRENCVITEMTGDAEEVDDKNGDVIGRNAPALADNSTENGDGISMETSAANSRKDTHDDAVSIETASTDKDDKHDDVISIDMPNGDGKDNGYDAISIEMATADNNNDDNHGDVKSGASVGRQLKAGSTGSYGAAPNGTSSDTSSNCDISNCARDSTVTQVAREIANGSIAVALNSGEVCASAQQQNADTTSSTTSLASQSDSDETSIKFEEKPDKRPSPLARSS